MTGTQAMETLKQMGWKPQHLELLRGALDEAAMAIAEGHDLHDVVRKFNDDAAKFCGIARVPLPNFELDPKDPAALGALQQLASALRHEHNASISPGQWVMELRQMGATDADLFQLQHEIAKCLEGMQRGVDPFIELSRFTCSCPA